MIETVQYAVPAAPSNNDTVVLYNSAANGRKHGLALNGITRVIINFISVNQASANDGFKAYASIDGGANWYPVDFDGTMPATVAATSAGVDARHDFDTTGYLDLKFEYTAGATAPTTWIVSAVAIRGIRDTGR